MYLCRTLDNLVKQDIRALSLSELQKAVADLGEKAFRAKQLYEWIWKKSARSFDEMTNLSTTFRESLNEKFCINAVTVDLTQKSIDGTMKCRFKLFDSQLIEGVLIPSMNRTTACISSQVGCSLSCKFCATGFLDRKRNLNADEIYDQVVLINNLSIESSGHPLNNIVYMGMGEPMLNYANVLKSIEKITSPDGLGMSPKRITVSTAGVAKMIKKLADDASKVNLALSLHAANDEKRDKIMPINETNNLEALADALKYYYQKTENRVTFEYIVFNNFNDSLADAAELAKFCKNVPCKVNLIEYNQVENVELTKTTEDKLAAFAGFLESKNIVVNVRRSRGKDIDAACGQLANK